jgi:hypothetical protein
MNSSEKFKKALPHLLAIVIFITVSLIYFYPLLEGKTLLTNDGTVYSNSSKEIHDFRAKYGEEPLWTNSMFSGMPAYLISTFYKGNVFKSVFYAFTFLRPASFIFLMMLGFYILLLMFKTDYRIAIAGALAYGFTTYLFFIIAAGHNTKAIALAYMAPMIGSIVYAYRRDIIKGTLLFVPFLTLEIMANHPQITYYAAMCVLIFVIMEFIRAFREKELSKFIKTSLILLGGAIIAVGMNFGALYTTYEYGKYSTRSKSELQTADFNKTSGLDKDYITQWSFGIDETLTLMIPNFRGGASKPFDRTSETVTALRRNNASEYINQFQQYWGSQPLVDGPVYLGAIIVFLFVLGLVIVKDNLRWWLLAATILSIALAYGKNFMFLTDLFIDYFPGYNKFRAVTTILVIAIFAIPFLGMLALRNVFNGSTAKKDIVKGIKIAAGITGGLALLFVIFPKLAGAYISPTELSIGFPEWLTTALVADRQKLLQNDALKSFLLIMAAAGLILAFINEKLKKEYAILAIAVLFIGDMWVVNKRCLAADRFVRQEAKIQTPTVADSYILRDTTNFRTLNLSVSTFNDASTSYFHKSIGGYHGAKLKRYQELIELSLSREMNHIIQTASSAQTIEELQVSFDNTPTLNMLNTKHVIYSPDAPPIDNEKAMGNAWFVEQPLFVENANEEIMAVNTTDLNVQAVIDKRFNDIVTKSSYPLFVGDTIITKSYHPNKIVYSALCSDEKLAVFSEIYYSAGWKSYIDGVEVPHFRANYVLRAMVIPQGNHEIVFKFEPASYFLGNKVAYTSSGIFILLIIGHIVSTIRKKRNAE